MDEARPDRVATGTIDRRTLREQILERIRALISSGELPPGTRLVEQRLCDRLGVSRGTVREALRQLQEEGVVTSNSRGPVHVRALTPREVADIYQVRAALEGVAAEMAAASPDRGPFLLAMHRAANAMANPRLSYRRRIDHDLRFHELLCEASGNPTLLRTWRQLSGPIRALMISAGPELVQPFQESASGHAATLAAVETGNPQLAREILARQLNATARFLEANVQGPRQPRDTAPGEKASGPAKRRQRTP